MYRRRPQADNLLAPQMAAVLRQRPCVLISDVDGTLAPIVAVPSRAHVPAATLRVLARLRKYVDSLAVVSGRSIDDARTVAGFTASIYVGNHGFEWLVGQDRSSWPGTEGWVQNVQDALSEFSLRSELPGVFLENKGPTATVHVRRASDPESTRLAARALLQPIAARHHLILEDGRMAINLLPSVPVNKGTAVQALANQYDFAGLVYLGDDRTDVHAFRTLRRLRQSGKETLSVAVASEENADVAREADAIVSSVVALRAVLERVAKLLESKEVAQAGGTIGVEAT